MPEGDSHPSDQVHPQAHWPTFSKVGKSMIGRVAHLFKGGELMTDKKPPRLDAGRTSKFDKQHNNSKPKGG
jgi:hypothetical protein